MKGLFGTNAASDPEVYKLPDSTQQLFETHNIPLLPDDEEKTDSPDDHQEFKSIHEGLFDRAYNEFATSLQMVPVADPAIGSLERGYIAI